MLFTTPEQFVALAAVLLGGWLIGFASAPSPRKWKRRVRAQSDSFTRYHEDAKRRARTASERIAELTAQLEAAEAERAAPVRTEHDAAAPAPPAPEMPESAPLANGARDDLTRLRGIDDMLDARLSGLGVTRFEDLETLSAEDEMALEARLDLPVGYIAREQWRTQAALLHAGHAGDHATYFAPTQPA